MQNVRCMAFLLTTYVTNTSPRSIPLPTHSGTRMSSSLREWAYINTLWCVSHEVQVHLDLTSWLPLTWLVYVYMYVNYSVLFDKVTSLCSCRFFFQSWPCWECVFMMRTRRLLVSLSDLDSNTPIYGTNTGLHYHWLCCLYLPLWVPDEMEGECGLGWSLA